MSVFHSITIYASDTDGLGTELPTIIQLDGLASKVKQTYEVRKIDGKPIIEADEEQYLGNFILVSNKWRYDFEPSVVPIYHSDTLQSIEEKFDTSIIDKTYHWLILGEYDASTPFAWTKRYPVQPQGIKDVSNSKAIAVNILKYDISYDTQKGLSIIDMQIQARKTGTVS